MKGESKKLFPLLLHLPRKAKLVVGVEPTYALVESQKKKKVRILTAPETSSLML